MGREEGKRSTNSAARCFYFDNGQEQAKGGITFNEGHARAGKLGAAAGGCEHADELIRRQIRPLDAVPQLQADSISDGPWHGSCTINFSST